MRNFTYIAILITIAILAGIMATHSMMARANDSEDRRAPQVRRIPDPAHKPVSSSFQTGPGRQRFPRHVDAPPPGPGHLIPLCLRNLNLTEDQREALSKILESVRTESGDHRNQMREAERDYYGSLFAAELNEEKVAEAEATIMALTLENLNARFALNRRLRENLGEEDLSELADCLSEPPPFPPHGQPGPPGDIGKHDGSREPRGFEPGGGGSSPRPQGPPGEEMMPPPIRRP